MDIPLGDIDDLTAFDVTVTNVDTSTIRLPTQGRGIDVVAQLSLETPTGDLANATPGRFKFDVPPGVSKRETLFLNGRGRVTLRAINQSRDAARITVLRRDVTMKAGVLP